jgi:hypothetical protein
VSNVDFDPDAYLGNQSQSEEPAEAPQTGFDPDAYLAAAPSPQGFDPDAYLQGNNDDKSQRPAPEGVAGTFLRSAAKNAVPAVGALAGAEAAGPAGAAIGTALAGPVGTLVGGVGGALVGAFGGGYIVQRAQQAVLDKLGIGSTAQDTSNEEANPWASFAGGLAPAVATMGTSAAPAAARAFGAAIFGGQEAAQEYGQEGKVDPLKVAVAAGVGAVFNRPRAAFDPITGAARGVGEAVASRVPGRPDLKPDAQVEKDTVDQANDQPIVAKGVATEQPPVKEDVSLGRAPDNKPVRSGRVYEKDNAPSGNVVETAPTERGVNTDQMTPDQVAALQSANGEQAAPVSTGLDKLRPSQAEGAAQPAPQAEQPQAAPVPETAPAAQYPHPQIDGLVVDRTRSVPGGVGSDKAISRVFVDKNVPPSIDVAGQKLDPAVPMAVREVAFRNALKHAMSVPEGQRIPTATIRNAAMEVGQDEEKHWITAHGLDYDAYQQALYGKKPSEPVPVQEQPAAEVPAERAPEQAVPQAGPEQAVSTPVPVEGDASAKDAPNSDTSSGLGKLAGTAPDVTATVTRPKVVDEALSQLQAKGMQKAHDAISSAPPEKQALLARKALELLSNRTGAVKAEGDYAVARVPSKPAEVEGMNVTARSKADAERKGTAYAAAKSAFDAFAPTDEVVPTSKAQKAALRDRLQAAIDHAKEQNGGASPVDAYKPRVKPKEWQWLNMAQKLVNGRMTQKQITEFVTNEKLLRSGNSSDADMVRQGNRIEADVAMNKAPTVEQADLAGAFKDRGEFPGEVVPAEDVPGTERPATMKDLETQPDKTLDLSKMNEQEVNDLAAKHIDFDNISDEDLNKLASESDETDAAGQPKWKAEEAARQSTAAERMAAQRAARLAKAKGTVSDFFKDAKGSGLSYAQMFKSQGPREASLLHKIFSPTTVSDLSRRAEAIIREGTGTTARYLAQANARIEQFHRIANAAPEADRIDMMAAMDSGRPTKNPTLQPLADTLAPLFKDVRSRLEAMPSFAQQQFLDNFFPHMWKNPQEASEFVGNYFQKQGSAASLQHRTVLTIDDGLKAGLKLASTDPIDVSMRYLKSMHAFITSTEVLQKAVDEGLVKSFKVDTSGASGHVQPATVPPGYLEIKGRTLTAGQALYAPADFAHVYNNFLDAGFHKNPLSGKLFDNLQKTSNAVTSLELGFSGYHMITMAKEAMISEFARGVSQVASGRFKEGVKAMLGAPGAPVTLAKLGGKIQKAYTGQITNATPEMQHTIDLMTKAGGRLVGREHDPTMNYSAMGSFFTAWKRGALQMQMQAARQRVGEAQTPTGKAGRAGIELASMVGRTMQTVAQPLFEKYIPAVKAGAYYDTLHAWLDANPGASNEQQLAAARRIGDSIDNRFGEMVQDNIFWNKALKQSAQVMMRSYSWNLGTIREIGGGAIGLVTNPQRLNIAHPEYDPRAAYVMAMPAVVALTSAVYQMLKTGEAPKSMTDLVAPRTGGQSTVGAPERVLAPGYEKDVIGWAADPVHEAANKIATAPHMVWDMLNNRDWRDDPIANRNDPYIKQMGQYLGFVAKNLGPISIKQLVHGAQKGSNIGAVERSMGFRSAPPAMENPAYIKAMEFKRNQAAWKTKQRHELRDQALNR